MQYEILYEEYLIDLKRKVERYMKDGWIPQGGVSAVNTSIVRNNEIRYMQAMIKA